MLPALLPALAPFLDLAQTKEPVSLKYVTTSHISSTDNSMGLNFDMIFLLSEIISTIKKGRFAPLWFDITRLDYFLPNVENVAIHKLKHKLDNSKLLRLNHSRRPCQHGLFRAGNLIPIRAVNQ